MFCKWCGNTIKTTDKKCSSCGRETPPLSECGGFYDLKRPWEAAAIPTEAPVSMGGDPAATQEIMRLREENSKIRREANERQKMMTIICGALAGAFLIVLILWIVALCSDDSGSNVMPPVNNNPIAATEGNQGGNVPGGVTEPSEPAETTAPSEPVEEPTQPKMATVTLLDSGMTVDGCEAHKIVEQKDDEMTVEFYWQKPANKAETEQKPAVEDEGNAFGEDKKNEDPFAEKPEEGKTEETPEEEKNEDEKSEEEHSNEKVFDFANADKLILNAKWHKKFKDSILLSCDAGAMIGFENAGIEYLWQWAIIPVQAAEGEAEQAVEWNHIALTEEQELQPGELSEDVLPVDMQESGAEQIQLRCTITLTNEAGETVTVELSGFRVNIAENMAISFPEMTQTGEN